MSIESVLVENIQPYSNILHPLCVNIVFAVKARQPLIPKQHKPELHQAITGIITRREQKVIQINSMPDYIHIPIGTFPMG